MEDDFVHRQGGDGRYFHGEDYEGDGRRLNALVFGGIGAASGYKFYERWKNHGTQAEVLGASLHHGAIMAIRWKAWFVTVLWWLITTPLWIVLASGILDTVLDERPNARTIMLAKTYGGGDYQHWVDGLMDVDVTGPWFHGNLGLVWGILAVHFVVVFFAIGVTYNRHVRESEFKERFFFRLMTPFEPLVRRFGWKTLQSLVVVPIVLAIVSYNQ